MLSFGLCVCVRALLILPLHLWFFQSTGDIIVVANVTVESSIHRNGNYIIAERNPSIICLPEKVNNNDKKKNMIETPVDGRNIRKFGCSPGFFYE